MNTEQRIENIEARISSLKQGRLNQSILNEAFAKKISDLEHSANRLRLLAGLTVIVLVQSHIRRSASLHLRED
jgi:hypothetical protein